MFLIIIVIISNILENNKSENDY